MTFEEFYAEAQASGWRLRTLSHDPVGRTHKWLAGLRKDQDLRMFFSDGRGETMEEALSAALAGRERAEAWRPDERLLSAQPRKPAIVSSISPLSIDDLGL